MWTNFVIIFVLLLLDLLGDKDNLFVGIEGNTLFTFLLSSNNLYTTYIPLTWRFKLKPNLLALSNSQYNFLVCEPIICGVI